MAGAAVLALLMNSPQVKAEDEIVVFGGEFEDSEAKSKKIEKPAPPEEKSIENPQPAQIEPQEDLPSTQPLEEEPPVQIEPEEDLPPTQPLEEEPPVQIEPQEDLPPTQPLEEEPPVQIEPQEDLPIQPLEEEQPAQIEPRNFQPEDDDNLGNKLIFDDLNSLPEQQSLEQPKEEKSVDEPFQPTEISNEWQERVEEPVAVVPPPVPAVPVVTVEEQIEEKPARQPIMPRRTQPQQELKMLKPRFIKLAVDDTYTYYLDKEAVEWKKMPYSSSEYMADVWIRMIERKPAELDEDMAAYGTENFKAQIELAREQGYQYQPEDIKVLSQQAYILEHYYLRPKTRQVQFLCELEVFGRPQNTINERVYDYKNWENLVPGSVESTIYEAAIKVLGKSKGSERGHMNFIDMLEEYGRISLR